MHQPTRRRGGLKLLAAAALAAVGLAAHAADTWPSKPITIVVPFPPGGATDTVARLVAEKLGPRLGQTVVVDNKAGASGLMGTDAVAKAAPDGHTVTISLSTSLLINQFLFKKMPYNAQKDLVMVSQIAVAPIVLLAHPSVPASTAPELAKYLAANKGKLSYGSWGIGSAGHLSLAHLSHTAGEMSHVPYKGEAPMIQDLIGGQIQLAFASAAQAKTFVDAGKLKALGATGEQRLPVLPNVPTFAEQGIKDDVYRVTGWVAMAAPAATPKPVVQRLAAEVKAICEMPDVKAKVQALLGSDAAGRGSEEFAAIYKRDLPVWERLVKQTGATLD